MNNTVQIHYNGFLAESYPWINGGLDRQVRKNREFFSSHTVTPRANRVAIDLGAGCGFQSVPLAMLGFSVAAVDFCQPPLDALRSHAGDLAIETIQSNICIHSSWSGRRPALIVCMGDTLTHLPTWSAAEDLLRQCFLELDPGGRLVLTLRDYSREPDGAMVVIPVLREKNRIFLCKLEYHASSLTVQDILYSQRQGVWERNAGTYEKIRIAPSELNNAICRAGFTLTFSEVKDDIITIIGTKERDTLPGS